MNPPDIDELWTRFLSDELTGADETLLVTTLGLRADIRDGLLADAEMDGMLRSLGTVDQESEPDQFVASVMQRLEAENPVAPPPVVQPPSETPVENLPIAEEIDATPSLAAETAGRQHIKPLKADGKYRQLNSLIAWSAYAAIAASLLIGFVVFKGSNVDDKLADIDPPAPIGSDQPDQPDQPVMPRPELAGTKRATDSVPQVPPNELEPLAPDALELAEDVSPPEMKRNPPPEPAVEPALSGFAVLVASSKNAQWYETPRELTGQSLDLQRGTAQFRLASGAIVAVSAPTQFRIDSPNSLMLAAGCVSADVPTKAIGFAIDTPTARVVDLGTKFDISVSDNGSTFVQVVQGSVAVESESAEAAEVIVKQGDRKFVAAGGKFWDWKVEIMANIFGEISGSVNGQSLSANDVESLESMTRQIKQHPALVAASAKRARYVFNGVTHDIDEETPEDVLIASITRDLETLEGVVRKAVNDSGSYAVKGRLYVYGNLKEKLQVRRNVARIHGPRALGETFSEREKFEITGNAGELPKLQAKLNQRLDVFGASDLADQRKQPRDRNRAATVVQPNRDEADDQPRDVARKMIDVRKKAFRTLDEIDRRKNKPDGASPIETEGNSEPSATKDAIEERPTKAESAEPTEGEVPDKNDAADSQPAPTRRFSRRSDPAADAAVVAALEAELNGDQDKRDELLTRALVHHETHPQANWHLGNVKVAGRWMPVEEAQERGKSSPIVASYKRMRDVYEGSTEGELKLARWCKTRRPQAARMYYARLLNNSSVTNAAVRAEAAKNLNLVPYGGSFVKQSQLEKMQARQETWRNANRRWSKPLEKWTKWLRPQARPEHQKLARKEMQTADDLGMILAANQFATRGDRMFGVQLVNTANEYQQPEASHLLCNIAMNSAEPVVRLSAVTALKHRKQHGYIPDLLGSLIGPVKSGWTIVRQPDGTIRYEHRVLREGAMENKELLTVREAMPVTFFDTDEQRLPDLTLVGGRAFAFPRPGDPSPELAAIADPQSRFRTRPGERLRVQRELASQNTGRDQAVANELARTAMEQDQRIAFENARAKAYNDRIFKLLTATTDQDLPPDPPQWWKWWTDYNEIELEKPTQRSYDYDRIEFVDQVYGLGTRLVRERHSCFAAGTPVATETGMRPIDNIVAGDRVYTKNVETGELSLQTVLTTTVRQSDAIVELSTAKHTLHTTPGHPFWVSGEGWRMAKLLKEGDQLHTIGGGVKIDRIRTRVGEPVFNLIVDQVHNYFVGDAMLMAHDHTFRTTSGQRLPGLE